MSPLPTLERVWCGYLAAVLVVAATATDGNVAPSSRLLHFVVHAAVLVAVLGVHRLARRRSEAALRVGRTALAIVGLPIVFSAMGWLLPAVHPEPYEFTWLQVDRAWFGGDVGALAGPWLSPWLVELLQLVYASFYMVPILAGIGALRSGLPAFDRALLALVFGFLASYLGYLLVPTLGPKVVLAFPTTIEGLWATASVRAWIDRAEANPWDCFPSGHTMLTVTSLLVLWRWNRRWFVWLLLPSLLLIASTMLLRYHWAIDVLVGLAAAWPCLWLSDRLADRDGWPRVTPA